MTVKKIYLKFYINFLSFKILQQVCNGCPIFLFFIVSQKFLYHLYNVCSLIRFYLRHVTCEVFIIYNYKILCTIKGSNFQFSNTKSMKSLANIFKEIASLIQGLDKLLHHFKLDKKCSIKPIFSVY